MSSGALVFTAVRVVDPASAFDGVVDVVIEDGVVTRVGKGAAHGFRASDRVHLHPLQGGWMMPGFIDLHAHLREPGFEGKEDIRSGLLAAAAGGFTDVCVMPNTNPVNDNRLITELMIARAREAGGSRLHPIAAITMGQRGEALTEMATLKKAGAVGVSDDGRCVTNSAVMRRALEYASTFDVPVIQHAEDHALTEGAQMHEGAISSQLGLRGWPRAAEDVIVARDLILAETTGAKYHLAHASTAGSVRLLREAKSRGIRASAEVTPHHLLLTHASVLGYNTACKVNPPLREQEDCNALIEALADGTIDCIATDHAPHTKADKDALFADAAMGMIGLELCVGLLLDLVHSKRLPIMRFAEALTTSAAKVVALPTPRIKEGERANLVAIDPDLAWRIDVNAMRTKGRNTPFHEKDVRGKVMLTMADGKVVFDS